MRHVKAPALSAVAAIALLAGTSAAPQPAEAGRLSRAVGTAVAVGVTKSAIRRANAAERTNRDETREPRVGEVKAVDHAAHVADAKAKLADEGENKEVAPMAPVVNKIVCVAGCD